MGPSAEPASRRELAAFCRLIYNFRLIALLVEVGYLAAGDPGGDGLGVGSTGVALALIVGALASYLPLKLWDRIGGALMRHPSYLAADMLLGMGLLLVLGAGGPFLYFTLGTALLSGALYRRTGAIVFSVLLLALYYGGLGLREAAADLPLSFALLVGSPVLYPLAAAGGAAVRRLLDRQAATDAALAASEQSAALDRERARIARDMHDSVSKSLQGIALSASGLGAWLDRDPERALVESKALATSAERTAVEARDIISDLREDVLDAPLDRAMRTDTTRWSADTGIEVRLDLAPVDQADAAARWELFSILREALHNVARHAAASSVEVRLYSNEGHLSLEVTDDGDGFEVPGDLAALRRQGHFGLIGMHERAGRVGGRLEVVAGPEGGTAVSARVPHRAEPLEPRGETRVSVR